MFSWAQEDGWTYGADRKIVLNPVRDVKKIRYAPGRRRGQRKQIDGNVIASLASAAVD
jgi:hypothetical protein